MKRLNDELFDEVALQAAESPRRRMHYDLRDTEEEQTMRMLNVLMTDTRIPVHRHTDTSEIVCVVKGRVREVTYDEIYGQLVERDAVELTYGGPCPCVVVPTGTWHTCQCLEDGSVILEVKTGKYDPKLSEVIFEEQKIAMIMNKEELKERIRTVIDMELRSAAMAPITPLHISRMLNVPLEGVEAAMKEMEI